MIPLLYSLHSGNLYGTERMALATAIGLRDQYDTVFFAPEGPFRAEALRLGFPVIPFTTPSRYLRDTRALFATHGRLAAISTRVLHSAVCALWAGIYRRDLANLHVIHGGADEKLSYGRKRWLDHLGVKQVAVSEYVRTRLITHRANPQSLVVIENFLTREQIDGCPRKRSIEGAGLRKVAIISRLDPIKRVDLLFEALDLDPSLRSIEFDVYGRGSDEQVLRSHALARHPNVSFQGFRSDVAERLTKADLLLHLCPEEPFGLAILEAMAAGVPVLVPDQGGAGDIVTDGGNGYRFRANDAWDLARKLQALQQTPAAQLRSVVAEGFRSLRTRYSAECGTAQYHRLIQECWI